jgi:hypothetical protein
MVVSSYIAPEYQEILSEKFSLDEGSRGWFEGPLGGLPYGDKRVMFSED